MLNTVLTVPKENIADIKFAQEDVLDGEPSRVRLRNIYLNKAQTMGNLFKHKVKIYFKTIDEELMAVETTIWSADDDFISVKGATIPTKSVWAIDF